MSKDRNNRKVGFTLVELLVVMSIISVLATVMLGAFRSSQFRSRDARRKSDLKQIANALEMFYSDYQRYPAQGGSGEIAACAYDPALPLNSGICTWESGNKMEDDQTVYFRTLPKDPSSTQYYYYRSLESDDNQAYQLYARLENREDKGCIGGVCLDPSVPTGVVCGVQNCNFSITSANIAPSDSSL